MTHMIDINEFESPPSRLEVRISSKNLNVLLRFMLTCILIFLSTGLQQLHRFFRFRAETFHGESTSVSILSAPYIVYYIRHVNSQVDSFGCPLQNRQLYCSVDFANVCDYFMIPISILKHFCVFSRLALMTNRDHGYIMIRRFVCESPL